MSNNQIQTNPPQAAPSQDLLNTKLNIPTSQPSKGKIAGITIGVLLLLAAIGIAVYLLLKSKDEDKGVNWLAVGDGKYQILSSEDGIVWNKTNYIFGKEVNAVAYGMDDIGQTLWVAATEKDDDQDTNLIYSNDGNNWFTGAGTSFDKSGKGVAYGLSSDDTTKIWVAVGDNTNKKNILFSTDGQSWTEATGTTFTGKINSVAYGLSSNGIAGKWIAVGDGASIFSSLDGQTWKSVAAPTGQTSSVDFESVAFGISSDNTNVWVATGSSTGHSFIYSNTGGDFWKEDTTKPFSTTGKGVAFGLSSNGASIWVGVGEGDDKIKHSSNVKTWVSSTGIKFNKEGNGVAYGNHIWVAVGDGSGNEILYSKDGQSWKATSGETHNGKGNGVASKYLNPSLESKSSKLFPS